MKLKSIYLVGGGIVLAGMLLFFAYQFFPGKTKSEEKIIFGIATGYAPFVSINQKNEYEGFDIDVAREIGARLGQKIEFKDLGSMTSLFIALEKGMIDAIIWGLSITQDRLKKVSMIQYQGETVTAYKLLFWKKIPDDIKSMHDMNGRTVCVEPHSSQEAVLDQYPEIVKKIVDKVDDALLNIQYGKADAALVEPAIAKKFKAKFPDLIMLNVPLDESDQVHGIGIAVLPGNQNLIKKLESAIAEMRNRGAIEKFEKKWDIA